MNSVAEHLENAGIPFAYFPCKRDDPDLSNVHKILTTIAYSLAEYYDDYRGFLSDLINKPSGRSALTGDVRKQSELLFGKAYEQVSPEGARRPSVHVILIDALDECRNHRNEEKTAHERRVLLCILLSLADVAPWIKVIITSRPEPDIADFFLETTFLVHSININSADWNTSADIRLFIEAQSKELRLELTIDQVNSLELKASGLFIWCTTVFRFIQRSKQDRKLLVADILNGQRPNSSDDPHAPLYLLYQRVLESAVSEASDREVMESVLSVIFVASTRQPLSANAIADILYPNEREGKREWVQNIVNSLLSIMYIEGGTNAVRVCHLSVLDFIGRMMTGGFSTLTAHTLKVTHMRMFEGCFATMSRELRFNICELEDSFRLNKDVPDLLTRVASHISEVLRYACLFWLSHLEQPEVDANSTEEVLSFLTSQTTLFWIEALSLMDAVDRGIVILQDCALLFTVRPSSCYCDGEQQLTMPRIMRMSQIRRWNGSGFYQHTATRQKVPLTSIYRLYHGFQPILGRGISFKSLSHPRCR